MSVVSEKTAIFLFSGIGDMEAHAIQSGYKLLACVKMYSNLDSKLREMIQKEGIISKIYNKDVQPDQLLSEIQLNRGELDLLCSDLTYRALYIEREHFINEYYHLVFEVVRFASVLLPKVILIKQHREFLDLYTDSDKQTLIYDRLLDQLDAIGYVTQIKFIPRDMKNDLQNIFIISLPQPNNY